MSDIIACGNLYWLLVVLVQDSEKCSKPNLLN